MGHNTEFEGEFALSKKNEIIVYQPNETMRLDVRLENETVWLTQSQMGILWILGTDPVKRPFYKAFSGSVPAKSSITMRAE